MPVVERVVKPVTGRFGGRPSPSRSGAVGADKNKYEKMLRDRRNDFDVTNTVQVSNPAAVRNAVCALLEETWPDAGFDKVWLAFYDFERLFTGRMPGYFGCDTSYHDIQHSLDITLAMARLLAGYERSANAGERLGPERALLGVIAALFHDAGYIRHEVRDREYRNGAEFTLYHVSRSADFLRRHLPALGLGYVAPAISKLVHFTGYEISPDDIRMEDPLDTLIGHLLGTADLVAQMADRCYLEKCRDRLYSEFVLGGIAFEHARPGEFIVRYHSGEDLLSQTPAFWEHAAKPRLEKTFGGAYRYFETLFDGTNPYMEAIEANLRFLHPIIENGYWQMLRRKPACYVGEQSSLRVLREMVQEETARLERARMQSVAG
ncbi:MAG: HD domain-containing protein [Gammaproteobacteria bacterium]|jgi:hypothetical protein